MIRKIAGLAVVTAVSLMACGTAGTSEFNADDVMFAQMMIPHHEQAILLAEMAVDPDVGAGASIIELASRIEEAQGPEIQLMTDLLEALGEDVSMGGMDHGSMMKGMLSTDELDQIAMLRGPEFDVAWATAMIAHHEGAVAMAEDVLASGKNPDIDELARAIIDSQTAEIAELKAIIGS